MSRQKKKQEPTYVWVKRTHPAFRKAMMVLIVVGVATASPPAMALAGLVSLVAFLFGVTLPAGKVFQFQCYGMIAFIFIFETLPYYFSKCPLCGHDPTRKKGGGWLNLRVRDARLRTLTACPSCGQ